MGYLDGFNDSFKEYYRFVEEQNAIIAQFQQPKAFTAATEQLQSALESAGFSSLSQYKGMVEGISQLSKGIKSLETYENVRKQLLGSVALYAKASEHYSVFGSTNIAKTLHTQAQQFAILSDIRHNFVETFPEYDITEDDIDDVEAVDEKIVSSLINPDTGESFKNSDKKLIISALPITDDVLKYLAENPQELYKLNPRDFEKIMAEIYSKLGYDVQLTQATRDGGKDIILTDHRAVGDWIYYAECKHHQKETQHVGVGVIQRFYGTISADKVNGGIVATNSFFSKPARDFILDHNCQCQIKLHDGEAIIDFMKKLAK